MTPKCLSRLPSRAGLAIWAALLAAGSLISRAPRQVGAFLVPGADKLLHVADYAVLCLLIVWALDAGDRRRRILACAAAAFAYGVLMELAQALTGRNPSLGDVAANGVGELAGMACAMAMGRSARRRRETGAAGGH